MSESHGKKKYVVPSGIQNKKEYITRGAGKP